LHDGRAQVSRVIQGEETRYRYGIQFDLAGQIGVGNHPGLDILIFMKAYVNLTWNLHGRSFCWHKVVRKHRGML
jgi:hypothetical protein